MTFSALRSAINSLRLHDLAETNVVDVRSDGSRCILAGDESEVDELREELKQAQEEAKQSDRDADDAAARADQMERERDEARQLLAAIKDGTASLADYIKRAEQANGLAQAWREHAGRVEKEVTALRKRKGVDTGYFAAQSRVFALLRTLATQPHGSPHKAEAEWIMETIRK